MKKIILSLVVLICLKASAQDLSMDYYSFLYNKFNINPAYCAKDEKISAILNLRQRAGLSSNNSMFGIKGILGENQGMGARIISDNRGAFQVIKADATYGYRVKINEDQKVYFGLSAGITNKSLNKSKIKNYDALDLTDPVLESSNLRSNLFTAGAGLVYEFKRFEFSAGAPQLLEGPQKLSPNVVLMANYKFPVNENITLTPEAFYFNLPVVKSYGGIQLKGDYKNKIWAQAGYQSNSTFNFGVGVGFNVFEFGYGYMAANDLMKSQSSGTHEVILKIGFTKKQNDRPEEEGTKTKIDPSGYSNRLNSVIDKLNELTVSDSKLTKEEIKKQLDLVRTELKEISNNNFSTEDPETIEKKLILIEGKIQQVENSLKKK